MLSTTANSDLPIQFERPADNYIRLPTPEYLTSEGQQTLQNVLLPRAIEWAATLNDPWRTNANMGATINSIWGELYPNSPVMDDEQLAVIEAKVPCPPETLYLC
jgi:hypothetical protein